MHFLFYEKLFMDFEIQSVSDLFSILFKMEGQTDLEIATSKDLANLSKIPIDLHFLFLLLIRLGLNYPLTALMKKKNK